MARPARGAATHLEFRLVPPCGRQRRIQRIVVTRQDDRATIPQQRLNQCLVVAIAQLMLVASGLARSSDVGRVAVREPVRAVEPLEAVAPVEEKIRAELGLAPLPAEAQRLWDETGGVRKPLTLKEPTPLPTGNAIGLGAEQKKRSDAAELADALTEWLGPLAPELDQLSADTEISDEEFSRRLSACAEGRKNGSTGKLETFLEGQIYDGMARGMTS